MQSTQTSPMNVQKENNDNTAEVPSFAPYSIIDFDKWKQDKTIKRTKTARIKQIINPLTLLLNDLTIIRLASLDIPDFANTRDAPINDAALLKLRELLPPKTEIHVFQTRSSKKGRVNRMQHQLAHIVTKKDNLWINGFFLSQGLARHYTMKGSSELLDQMHRAEGHAIKETLGLWGLYPVLTPETAPQNLNKFVVIKGTVQKVAMVKNKLYLNFGKDWKTDFTIMLDSFMRKKLSQQGIDPTNLAGQEIQARGWLRDYNGAYLELEDIAHLKILSVPSPNDINLDNGEALPKTQPTLKVPTKRMGQQ